MPILWFYQILDIETLYTAKFCFDERFFSL